MRLFVGIDLSSELKTEIACLQKALKPVFKSGGWKTEDQFHITLKFLGEVPEERLTSVQEAVKDSVFAYARSGGKQFTLCIDRLDYFGLGEGKQTGNRPVRVLWLGLSELNFEPLHALQQAVENAFADHGFRRDERPYVPHVTLAQDTTMLPAFNEGHWQKQILQTIAEIPIAAGKLTLFLSEQQDGKRVYKPIFDWKLYLV